jgi:phenylacetate-coenzyme A ligase PaaK-like adenylate-forming protein
VHGRSAGVLVLDGVTVHPLQFAALAADQDVREFQVVQHGNRLTLRVVCADGTDVAALGGRLTHRVGAALHELGVADPQIAIEPCLAIDRPASGKLPLVVAEPAPQAVA